MSKSSDWARNLQPIEPGPEHHVIADLAARLAKAERALEEANGWRPIETAPKDGTDVLVARRENDDEDEGEFAVAQWWVFEWAFMSNHPGDMPALLGFTPTHWRPLPSPPKEG